MRHVPTSLYIDTELFKRNGLRFDTSAFRALRDTFAQGGLRLLVPAIFERELLRHFAKEADKVAAAVVSAHGKYPANRLSIAELPSQEDLTKRCFEEINQQWNLFKGHFVVENLPIAGSLEDVVDWYFDVQPPFSAGSKSKEFPDAFILSALDLYHKNHHANIAVVSNDGDFCKACASRRFISHFSELEQYIDAFKPELSGHERFPGDIDFTRPITTEDLTELKTILARGNEVTAIELERVMQLLERKGSNYDYFFQNADATVWLEPLSKRGFFFNPPKAELSTEGHYIAPQWPPIDYLTRIFDSAPLAVMDIVLELPKTNNVWVLEGILKIVLKANSASAVHKCAEFIMSFIENCRWEHELIISLLNKQYIFDPLLAEFTPALLLKIVEFRTDPREHEKRAWHKENPEAWGASLEPIPRFDTWEYEQILENGVLPLAAQEPYQVSRILIDAVGSMIRLGMHIEEMEAGRDQDYSEIWCRRLDKPDRDYRDAKETLVHTLTHVCEQVYEKTPESLDALDQALRNQRWKVFKRLRQFLYSSHPNDQTLPWIREEILGHDGYSKWEHDYEFQLMLRRASEYFGPRLLSDEEQNEVFDAILAGPSNIDFREWIGDQYSEDLFQRRKRHFHLMQLRPFAALLRGDIRDYYNELKGEPQAETITDDSYAPFGTATSGTVSYQSPKSIADLERLSDEELLIYLNEWDEEYSDTENGLVEINIRALAGVFQSFFKDRIALDSLRLNFWIANYHRLARPIYVRALLKAMTDLVKEKDFVNLDQWIKYCGWVLSHQDTVPINNGPEPNERSRDHPDWRGSRRAVVDFIDACTMREADAPISARQGLAGLLRKACCQFNWRLDHNRPVLLKHEDPSTEALNNTRTRALEALINFGFWVRRRRPKDPVSEVTEIIGNRIAKQIEIPLTRPEHALLGMHFGNISTLDWGWAAQQRGIFFPQSNPAIWRDAFGSYIRFNRPEKMTFEILRDDFLYALNHLCILDTESENRANLIDRLGQHLFSYYLWGVYPLTGDESLLELFYYKTNEDRKKWGQLFDHIGRSLRNSGGLLASSLASRIVTFFDWRLEVGESLELQEFGSWLGAECLEAEWRLASFSKTLDLGLGKTRRLSIQMNDLRNLLPDHPALVVECFAKLTDALNQTSQIYISAREANPILEIGLNSEDDQVRGNAERALENLLRQGRFDFLEIKRD